MFHKYIRHIILGLYIFEHYNRCVVSFVLLYVLLPIVCDILLILLYVLLYIFFVFLFALPCFLDTIFYHKFYDILSNHYRFYALLYNFSDIPIFFLYFLRHIFYSKKNLKTPPKRIKLDNFVINRYNTRCCRHEMSNGKA